MEKKKAELISYDTEKEKFESLYERNKFYRGLFGYKQTVKKNEKVYKYEKEGLIDKIPNIKVEDSVIIVSKENADKFISYFKEWKNKICYRTFTVLLEPKEFKKISKKSKNKNTR